MPNTFIPTRVLTGSAVAKEILYGFGNNLVMTKNVKRNFDKNFGVAGAKIGTILNVKLPIRAVGKRGAALQVQDIEERTVAVALDQRYQQSFTLSTEDLTVTVDQLRERILNEHIAQMSNEIDSDGCALYPYIYNCVGTPGTVPATTTCMDTYLDAGVKLDNEGVTRDGTWAMVISSAMQARACSAYSALFNDQKTIADQFLNGTLGRGQGFKWNMDQNVATHVVGPQGGASPAVSGAGQSGNTLLTAGWTAAAANRLLKGDIFTIGSDGAGTAVYAVNPKSRKSTGQLRQFTVTADFDSLVAGTGYIQIEPAIEATGAYQTVNVTPASGALINVLGTAGKASPQGLAFQRDAFCFACADLFKPEGVHFSGRESDPDIGISVRIVQQYTIDNDMMPCRMDVLGGWKVLQAARACRVAS